MNNYFESVIKSEPFAIIGVSLMTDNKIQIHFSEPL